MHYKMQPRTSFIAFSSKRDLAKEIYLSAISIHEPHSVRISFAVNALYL